MREKVKIYFTKDSNNFAGAVKDFQIEKLQKKVQLEFSHAYKKFLLLYGGAGIKDLLICGLRYIYGMGKDFDTLDKNTAHYKKDNFFGTKEWYIPSDDGFGNPIGVDKEGKVWMSDHDFLNVTLLANDFEEFLCKVYLEDYIDAIYAYDWQEGKYDE